MYHTRIRIVDSLDIGMYTIFNYIIIYITNPVVSIVTCRAEKHDIRMCRMGRDESRLEVWQRPRVSRKAIRFLDSLDNGHASGWCQKVGLDFTQNLKPGEAVAKLGLQ